MYKNNMYTLANPKKPGRPATGQNTDMPGCATQRQERSMVEKAKQDAKTEQDPVKKLRAVVLSRGSASIKGIARVFRIMDDDGDKVISIKEFKKGLKDYGVFLDTDDEFQAAFDCFDKDGDGSLCYDEFLVGLRGPIPRCRETLIRQAFNKLDKDGSGEITIDDLKGVYSVQQHPKFQNGEWTEDQILKKYLEQFEGGGGVKGDGVITWDEFMDYYAGVSASVDTNAYFDLMMRSVWKLG